MNRRQVHVLLKALRSPRAEFSTRSHQSTFGVDVETARADLEALIELGYLTGRSGPPEDVLRPADDLSDRLKGRH